MSDVNFAAAAAFDRELFWEAGASVRYLVARLRAQRRDVRRQAERAPLNIALVIDASGSMAGGKLEAAKEAALGLAERLTGRDRLTVVSFASEVIVHLDAVAVTPDNAARIGSEIARLRTRGSTFLSGGWFAGVESAARISEVFPSMTPRVIILSDGHANEGIVNATELREHAVELRMRGVVTSCLGIGNGYDEQLLRGIAENGGGRLHDAELTSEISSVLLGELDDICGTVVEDAQIELQAPGSVRVEALGRSASARANGRLLLPLGPIQNGVERVAVFKVTCPAARPNDVLAFELTASGRAVDDQSRLATEALRVRLTAAEAAANDAQSRDIEIATIVARTWKAHVATTTAGMNRDGAFGEAEGYAERELRYFRRYVEGLDRGQEMIEELEILARHVGRQLSSRVRKEMVLQSSLALEGRHDRRGPGKADWNIRMQRGE